MKSYNLFLLSLVPIQAWGTLVYFYFVGSPNSLEKFVNTLLVYNYTVIVNIAETLGLALFALMLSQLLPKSLSKNKVALIQMTVIAIMIAVGIVAQLSMTHTQELADSPLVFYYFKHIYLKSWLRRLSYLMIYGLLATPLLLFVRWVIKSSRSFSRVTTVADSVILLGWFYLVIDIGLFAIRLLRHLYVI